MVRRVDKVLEVTRPEVIPEVTHDASRVASETLALSLFNIEPRAEPEKPIRIDLDLDQLEDAVE